MIVSILFSILVCAAASLLCANVVSVQVFVPYYVIAGNTHELYNCLFRQVARFPCLAYAAEPAVILRRISLSRFTSLRLYVAPGIHILPYFLPENRIIYVDGGVVYNHRRCLCNVHLNSVTCYN